jgi:hypothetical protein
MSTVVDKVVLGLLMAAHGDGECGSRPYSVDEEEAAVAMNWQSGDSNNNGSNNSGSYETPKDEFGYILQKRGAQKGSDEPDLIISLRKRYGSVIVHSQS